MKKHSRILMQSILLVLLGLALLGGIASAASSVDQQQLVTDTTVGNTAIGYGSNQILAQVLTAGVTGKLTEVRLPAWCSGSNALSVQIQKVTGGKPNGVVLTSQAFGVSTLPIDPSPPHFKSFALKKHVWFAKGTQFAIVLKSKGSCSMNQGPVGNPYPGGDAYYDARPNPVGVWVPLSNGSGRYDLPFQTVVQPTGSNQ